jgi:type II secretory pathway pseudopilin PulG
VTAAPVPVGRVRALTLPRVILLLSAIITLAFVLPYLAVYTLHARRLQTADETTHALGRRVSDVLRADRTAVPAGTRVLAGPGDRPRASDDRWSAVAMLPMANVLGTSPVMSPDPWGNAYLVILGSVADGSVSVLSAGPDGILQTPLAGAADRAFGDDRLARIQ